MKKYEIYLRMPIRVESLEEAHGRRSQYVDHTGATSWALCQGGRFVAGDPFLAPPQTHAKYIVMVCHTNEPGSASCHLVEGDQMAGWEQGYEAGSPGDGTFLFQWPGDDPSELSYEDIYLLRKWCRKWGLPEPGDEA